MSKPAMLQLNARGSWRNVCEFDIADPQACALVMEAAATIATYAIGKPTVRIVTDDAGCTLPLMRWCAESGWQAWRQAA